MNMKVNMGYMDTLVSRFVKHLRRNYRRKEIQTQHFERYVRIYAHKVREDPDDFMKQVLSRGVVTPIGGGYLEIQYR